jgi:hypothetical protein
LSSTIQSPPTPHSESIPRLKGGSKSVNAFHKR